MQRTPCPDAEGDARLGGRARLGDDDDAKLVSPDQIHQIIEVVLADVAASKEHLGSGNGLVSSEVVAERLDDALGAEVAAADADADDVFTLVAELCSGCFQRGELLVVDAGWQV